MALQVGEHDSQNLVGTKRKGRQGVDSEDCIHIRVGDARFDQKVKANPWNAMNPLDVSTKWIGNFVFRPQPINPTMIGILHLDYCVSGIWRLLPSLG